RQTPQDDFDAPNEALAVPSAPYAVEHVQNAYRPPPPRWPGHLPRHKQPRHYRAPDWPTRPTARIAPSDWPDRDPDDTVARPAPSPFRRHPPPPSPPNPTNAVSATRPIGLPAAVGSGKRSTRGSTPTTNRPRRKDGHPRDIRSTTPFGPGPGPNGRRTCGAR